MQFFISLLIQWRQRMLSRQAGAVRQAVLALNPEQRRQTAEHTLAEIQAAARLPMPHRYGDNDSSVYQPWTQVAGTAAGRVRDRSVQLRQRSIALWLAVVYHETRGARDAGLQAVHREVLGMLRELKDHKVAAPSEKAWFDAAA
ncbi:MAG: hypothetical protein KA187_05220 [Arenimonas sp.]|nr:hypothetical protein [Arenimonas sp.]MBP6626797.1 hypothetical protein [Arenimonas sp.]